MSSLSTNRCVFSHNGHGVLKLHGRECRYSSVPNKRTGSNKRTGWNFDKIQISVQGGILIKILECRVKTGNFIHNRRDF